MTDFFTALHQRRGYIEGCDDIVGRFVVFDTPKGRRGWFWLPPVPDHVTIDIRAPGAWCDELVAQLLREEM